MTGVKRISLCYVNVSSTAIILSNFPTTMTKNMKTNKPIHSQSTESTSPFSDWSTESTSPFSGWSTESTSPFANWSVNSLVEQLPHKN